MTVELLWMDKLSNVASLAYLLPYNFKLTKELLWEDGSCISHPQAPDEAAALVASLRACAKNKDLCTGMSLHEDAMRRGLLDKCADALVTMYAKCGLLGKAKELLGVHKIRDLCTWNSLITLYAQKGQGQDALDCFERMRHEGLVPDAVTFSGILKACGSIGAADTGEQIHDEISKEGLLGSNVVLGSALVSMYAKCGALSKARQVLEQLPVRNVISWNALIGGYAQHGKGELALSCFTEMQREGLSPDVVTFICILKACGSIGAVHEGQKIHDAISKQGLLGKNAVLGNALINMYVKCGALKKARHVLQELPLRDAISWSALLTGYAEQGDGGQALQCFEEMLSEGLSPDAVTFICVLKACGSIGAADKGERIHDEISKQGILRQDIVLGNALVDMYVKCGSLRKARQLLEDLPVRDVISWSTLIAGYAQQGEGEEAWKCFEQMEYEGLTPNAVTFISILNACGSIGAFEKGQRIHNEIAKLGLLRKDVELGNALVHMYAKHGALAKAENVLEELPCRNVISWSTLIRGYAEQGEGETALDLFERMQREGLSPDTVTFICILKACGNTQAVDRGMKIHEEVAKLGLLKNDIVLGNALVDMYVKCSAFTKAHEVLWELPVRDVVTWNSLIAGYAQCGEGEQAMICFDQMQRDGLSPNSVTFTCILKACSSLGAVDKGEQFHDEIAKQGLLRDNIVLGTALVDMYAKCGALTKARQVLEELPVRNVISWNALIAGSVQQNEVEQALNCFEQLQREGLSPDAATFLCVLNACSRLGLVEDAQIYYSNMGMKYGMKPNIEHSTCMADLFGRAGHLDKAVGVIEKLPSCDNAVWSALLGACHKWGDQNIGRWAFEHAVQADTSDAAAYVLMAKIYAAAGMQEDALRVEVMRLESQALKNSSESWWIDTLHSPLWERGPLSVSIQHHELLQVGWQPCAPHRA